MNKKLYIILFITISVISFGCSASKPRGFTYSYNKDSNTRIEPLINIDGYYISQRECDSSFYSAFTFYPDGLFSIVTGTDLSEVVDCFFNSENTILCQNLSWGLYSINNDTIKTQTLRQEGISFCIIYRDYLVNKDKSLLNISDYVKPETTKIGYMRNYPSFIESRCAKVSKFVPSKKAKRNTSFCPYINAKWFVNK